MAGLKTTAKELEQDKKEIENDSFLSEMDNTVGQDDTSVDNMTDSDSEDVENLVDVKEDGGELDEDQEEEVPQMNIEGDNLVAPEAGVTVDLNNALGGTDTDDTSSMQETEEEKDASKNPADLFGMSTGASQIPGGFMGDAVQQDMATPGQETGEQADAGPLDTEMNTGATPKLGWKKRLFFKAISGLKKAKKGIGNFFKKKLPAAFKSGAKVLRKVMEKSPMAPMLTVYDKIVEYRRRTQPERDRKAEEKRAKKAAEKAKKQAEYINNQELKRNLKKLKEAEKARKELENPSKAKAFFKTIWRGIKTGVSWVYRKVRDSRFGRGVAASLKPLKQTVIWAKNRICDLIEYAKTEIDQMKDEYDAYSFEDRMDKISKEEDEKRAKGEEVPKDDYRTRYLKLTAELKQRFASTRDNIDRREEIEKALAELEGRGYVIVPEGGEQGEKESDLKNLVKNEAEWAAVRSATRDADISTGVFNGVGQTNWVTSLAKNTAIATGIVKIVSALGQIGAQAAKVDKYRNQKNLMEAIKSTTKDELIRRVSKYAQSNAELQEMTAGFNIAINALNAGRGVGEIMGNPAVAKAFQFAGFAVTGVKMLATSSKRRKGNKEGIKEMLGGRDGYYELKRKYRMHAPEMRRAVRDALGVATTEDAVTADKWELSHYMSERAKSGETTGEMGHMIAEAGGTSEKHFDALQGAGTKVRRRFVDRSKRMIA